MWVGLCWCRSSTPGDEGLRVGLGGLGPVQQVNLGCGVGCVGEGSLQQVKRDCGLGLVDEGSLQQVINGQF